MSKKMKFGEINVSQIKTIAIAIIVVVTVYQIAKAIASFFKNPVAKCLGALDSVNNWLDHWLGTCGNCDELQTDPDTGITTTVTAQGNTSCNKFMKLSCLAVLGIISVAIFIVFRTISGLFGWGKSPLAELWESITGKEYKELCKEIHSNIDKTLSDKKSMDKLKELTAQSESGMNDADWNSASTEEKQKWRDGVTSENLVNQVVVSKINDKNAELIASKPDDSNLIQNLKNTLKKEFDSAKYAFSKSKTSDDQKATDDAIDRVRKAEEK